MLPRSIQGVARLSQTAVSTRVRARGDLPLLYNSHGHPTHIRYMTRLFYPRDSEANAIGSKTKSLSQKSPMKTKNSLLTLTLLCALNVAALAQDNAPTPPPPGGHRPPPGGGPGGPGGPGRPRRPGSPVVAALDANHDGIIDAAEIANAPAALKALDKNNDGQLTADELHPPRPDGAPADGQPPEPPGGAAGQPPRPRPPVIAALDVNNDGVIDAQEIANAAASLLTLDANHDAKLTPDELRPAGGPKGGGGPGHGPRARHGGPGGPGGPKGGPDAPNAQ